MTLFVLSSCGDSSPSPSHVNTQTITTSTPEWVADQRALPALSESVDPTESHDAPAGQSEPAGEAVQTIYRPDDSRFVPDEQRLKALGIHKYESQRLILYTDIDPAIAQTLPGLFDQAYMALVDYFGEVPPARNGAEFQLTGYLIADRDRFDAADLIPVDLPVFAHGQHRGQEFWMYEQEYDYYRRHLLIHETTHCFTMIMPGIRPPIWYLEGMAELFATHKIDEFGKATFAVMPDDPANFVGFSRIEMIQEEVSEERQLDIDRATRIGVNDFAVSRSTPYAWSWAVCKFLDSHPRYQQRFRQLGQHLVGLEFSRLAETLFAPDKLLLASEWDQFVQRIEYGWDFDANTFVVSQAPAVPVEGPIQLEVHADQAWQSSGVRVERGQSLTISATGQVTLANDPKPWLSEPQGISIRYANGAPIGRLQAAVLVEEATTERRPVLVPFEVRDCGGVSVMQFESTGELFFQINDFGSERTDNSGAYQVRVTR